MPARLHGGRFETESCARLSTGQALDVTQREHLSIGPLELGEHVGTSCELDERLLHRIVSIKRIVADAQTEAIHALMIEAEHRLQRSVIAACRRRHELVMSGGAHRDLAAQVVLPRARYPRHAPRQPRRQPVAGA